MGNKGEEYKNTRHNAGRIILASVEKKLAEKVKAKFLVLDTFMNTSGKALAYYVKSDKDLKNLIVIHDDIDIPLGSMKISFNKSAGGHNGVADIIKTFKTQEFLRIRIGVCPTTPTGKTRKPKGEDKVVNFLLGEFKKEELEIIKKLAKKVTEAIEVICVDGAPKAMSLYN